MAQGGYARWGINFLQNPPDSTYYRPRIGDHVMNVAIGDSEDWSSPPSTIDLETLAGTQISQALARGADQPISMSRMPQSIRWTVSDDDDYRVWLTLRDGPAVRFFPSIYIVDVWLIEAAPGTQATWRTTRRLAYDTGAGITHATHPPRAFIDNVEQTVISSGTPVAGEVLVPTAQTADQAYETIETPAAGITGIRLSLWYPPEFLVRVTNVRNAVRVQNGLEFTVDLLDVLGGVYT